MAEGNVLGLTPCAPIIHQKQDEEDGFAGAICIDVDPSGSVQEYFNLDQENMPTHLLFNSDEAFESRENIDDSEFKEYIT